MKKRLGLTVLSVLMMVSSAFVAVGASGDESPLYKFVKKSDDTYGYDESTPVYYYGGSDEQIMIPNNYTQKKEQFKSAWIATIFNLHFPAINEETVIKEKYMERLDSYENMNMNAMIFQVRPLLDAAFYESDINPSSVHFAGAQGAEVSYDPMPWMIEETHRRGMEFHAWFNPYRVTNTAYNVIMGITEAEANLISPSDKVKALHAKGVLADNNFAVLNPEFALEFKGKIFINPGEQEVIDHVADTIGEFITKYDTDAIHFDDYFYPYKVGDDMFGAKDEDKATFEKYGAGFDDIEAWRRDNVTRLIDGVKKVIDDHNAENKTAVQFGISPFGIWEHKANDDRGSNTPVGSSQSYSRSIFADTYQWVKDEKLDYIAPQIYWSFGSTAAPYGEIARWWNDVAEGTNVDVYVGHANYKHVSNGGWDAEWMNPEEVNNQLKFNQKLPNITGSSVYAYSDIITTPGATIPKEIVKNESIEILKNDTFSTQSLTPSREKLSHGDVKAVDSVVIEDGILSWTDSVNDNARFYVIYAGEETDPTTLISNPQNILKKVMFDGQGTYTFEIPEGMEDATFAVTVLDKAYVETTPTTIEEPQLEVELGTSEVTLNEGEVIDEAEFINRLNIPSIELYDVATNFNDVVDFTKTGSYVIDVTITQKTNLRSGGAMPSKVVQATLNVTAKKAPEPEVKPDPKPEVKPEDSNTNKPDSKPGDKLPATGIAKSFPVVAVGAIILGAGLFLVQLKRKED